MRLISAFSRLAVFIVACSAAALSAPLPFASLIGTWSGSGSIRLENGRTEAVRCKAYYTDRAGALGIALRCASAGSKIDLRATLDAVGGRVAGTWEERQFNAGGSLGGLVTVDRLSLDMDGGGLKATVVVTTSGARQTLSIHAVNGAFRGATVALARD